MTKFLSCSILPNIDQFSISTYIDHLIFITLFSSLFFVSCSSTTRFPNDKSIEIKDKKVNLNFSSVRVLLDELNAVYHLTIQTPAILYNGEKRLAYIEPGNVIECLSDNDQVRLIIRDEVFNENAFILKPAENSETVSFNGQGYKGNLQLINLNSSISIINQLDLEDYVKGVVAEEMPVGKDSENYEALKAFSICVRTYALKKIAEGKSFYDLFDDTRDQVYGGLNSEHPLSNRAVQETENRILIFDGQIAGIYYHSTCGGRTEAAHNVFTDEEISYMMGVKDGNTPNCNISPKFKWKEIYSPEVLLRRVKQYLLMDNDNYRLRDVYIKSRFGSGRVNELIFEVITKDGDEKNILISGNEIRSIIRTANGKRILWSNFFDISLNDGKIELIGNGFGHGVGMCQWGAIALSKNGWSYEEIVDHYFPGTKIKNIND